jgi:transposase
MRQKKTVRPRLTDEQKRHALELLERGDVGITELAEKLGVSRTTIYRWQLADREVKKHQPLSTEERAELKRLREENKRLKMAAEILKKFRTFSAKHQR